MLLFPAFCIDLPPRYMCKMSMSAHAPVGNSRKSAIFPPAAAVIRDVSVVQRGLSPGVTLPGRPGTARGNHPAPPSPCLSKSRSPECRPAPFQFPRPPQLPASAWDSRQIPGSCGIRGTSYRRPVPANAAKSPSGKRKSFAGGAFAPSLRAVFGSQENRYRPEDFFMCSRIASRAPSGSAERIAP